MRLPLGGRLSRVLNGTHPIEVCEKCAWILEAWCVMSSHFHLVIRTPDGNIVHGMKWL